jgi:hypothetical protein
MPKLTEGISFEAEIVQGAFFGDTETEYYLDLALPNKTRVYLNEKLWNSAGFIKSARLTFEGHEWPRRQEAVASFAKRNPEAEAITLEGIRTMCPHLYEPRDGEALPIIVHAPTAIGLGAAESSYPWGRFVHHAFRSDSPTHPRRCFWESGEILAAIAPGPPLGTPLIEILLEGSDEPISVLSIDAKWRDQSKVPTVVAVFSSLLAEARSHRDHGFDCQVAGLGSCTYPR